MYTDRARIHDSRCSLLYSPQPTACPTHTPSFLQTRCESILRSNPNARFAKELHLASIEGFEQHQSKQMKEVAVGGVAVAAGIGLVAGLASLLMKRR